MTTPRPYAEPISAQAAIRELVRCAGAQFDPEVVDAFAAVQADLIAELVA
jgi:HD-GYP domain-containing protein (c-di-GMP phosphodiesterase class II)